MHSVYIYIIAAWLKSMTQVIEEATRSLRTSEKQVLLIACIIREGGLLALVGSLGPLYVNSTAHLIPLSRPIGHFTW